MNNAPLNIRRISPGLALSRSADQPSLFQRAAPILAANVEVQSKHAAANRARLHAPRDDLFLIYCSAD